MIKFENVEIVGFEPALRGMRNPKNSWNLSDSTFSPEVNIGEKDLELMNTLSNGGEPHRKYMRMIAVYMDITAPLYWWKEYDTYKVGTVANSCSTMHKIQSKKFTLDMFSHEHLSDAGIALLQTTIDFLEEKRQSYLNEKDSKKKKEYWWDMIQMLPTSYNQMRTVMLNYEVCANMYKYRNPHKLDEWNEMMRLFESFPYSEIITHKPKF